jgi:glutathione synthase/RimK-type ligase-like ATP-grasp enzyme
VVDPAEPDSYELTVESSPYSALIRLASGESLTIDSATRVWVRKPSFPEPAHFDGFERIGEYQARSYSAAWGSALACDALWMNRVSKSRVLETNKPKQADLARRSGLDPIPSMLTDSTARFVDFVNACRSDVAIKSPVSWHQSLADSDDEYGTYTRRLTREEAIRLAPQVAGAPLIVQPYIEKDYELRVTVVDECILACRIDSQESALTAVDWRHYDIANVRHSAVVLAGHLEGSIKHFMNLAGLRFAAIDLIVEPGGKVRFVEANPSGQYGWIESLTGLPISRAIADWLESP